MRPRPVAFKGEIARALREQVKSALSDLHPVGLNEINAYEPDTALYRATLEVQIWQ